VPSSSQDAGSGIEVIASEAGETSKTPPAPGASVKLSRKLDCESYTLTPRSITQEVNAFHSLTPFETCALI
jgi:hypothetical protein